MTVTSEPTTHRVALAFEDGVTRFITCRPDQTVADASYRQRINIPLDCRDGACGTCKALCESGSYDGGNYISDALSDDEAAAGYALPCCMKPRSDLVLQIASTSEIAKTEATSYVSTVVELQRLSATTVKLGVEIPNRSELAFLPGQYVNIAIPGTDGVSRSYSFSNAPNEQRLTFLIKLTPGGAMSTYLTERAGVGDSLTFTGPHGSFFLRAADRPILLLAGGTGLAPILSILRRLRDDRSHRRAHLIYGATSDDDAIGLDELAQLTTELPGFSWDYCVSDPASTAPNRGPEKAYVTSLMEPAHLYDGDVAIYLCGPPPMVEAVRKHVAQSGVEPSGFFYEKFALAAANAPTTDAPAACTPSATTAPVAEPLHPAANARSVAGQNLFPANATEPWSGPVAATDAASDIESMRRVAGQDIFPAAATVVPAAAGTPVRRPEPPTVTADGYQIGEEHPEVHESDALFEARQALELGALELTVGRLSSQQLAGYRLLAESTLPYVEGDHFIDAEQYTETNAAFHDYLFAQTGNEHLLHAYQALGVKGRMSEVLRNATWCHPLCAQDHLDIVSAFDRGDRDAARTLIAAHADRSKQTMRRAMTDGLAARRPKFVTPGRFSGKIVVVTGAAQGIGEHVARRISAEGGRLVMADRSELVKELADELVTGGPQAVAVTADLEHYAGAESVVQQALSEFGRIDVLINNVGGAINFKPFTEFTAAEIRTEIDRSLLTTLYTCRAALPSMVRRGEGVIVNVSSAATRGIHRIPYSAAKGGVNAITASLALEYADAGIRVVATAPGGTDAPPRRISRGTPAPAGDTEHAWFQAHIDQTIESSLMHRYGTLDEQAAAICFLASDEASYITGSVLPVAGGDQG
ncbi:1,6-dihydroxycyclohexa-2,4-diene-1-carboxylate dehydrogenase [Mycobacterium sp. CBMA293]|uniref:benzoate 1,2-dioxygenase electron transfer component BenC n=1 Tax=unclassified Mycolicibacterium TaxID=2636767 RepID=UPI0012DFE1CA|nr:MULTISPECIES: benzoate 1,2-dioxygenase electron transfer component BenC [unclassified Mycolicibacterium]MUL46874.1 1,6-dihydroxycyclohexa-2,4-diene-1-carboxylate dehydrogenase [Mycolicibacterium sp. CBMA 360]MUL57340.1 1,6-dihydroxycyclohexa-2,4-diene-1-carboxylate dehydrogenase [Mycolicibacterium sp. CBMA 335]MUL70380.1 1,6-dihydroxycyclohexa-2,4-diene-1-carboxylate dehydrogenase [Mycolicibacterium sp. CBMA 311]MUL92428.1 1,6-dihydroxycyclohexa-2,4-diene-1-carboxylate dehydrogenase [Mycolic